MAIPERTISVIVENGGARPMRRFVPDDKFVVEGSFLNDLNELMYRLKFSAPMDVIEREAWQKLLGSALIDAVSIDPSRYGYDED